MPRCPLSPKCRVGPRPEHRAASPPTGQETATFPCLCRPLPSPQEMPLIPGSGPHPCGPLTPVPRPSRRFAKLAGLSERWGEAGHQQGPGSHVKAGTQAGRGGPVGTAPRGAPLWEGSAAWAAAARWALFSPPAQESGCQLVAHSLPGARHTLGQGAPGRPTGLSRPGGSAQALPAVPGGGLSQRNGSGQLRLSCRLPCLRRSERGRGRAGPARQVGWEATGVTVAAKCFGAALAAQGWARGAGVEPQTAPSPGPRGRKAAAPARASGSPRAAAPSPPRSRWPGPRRPGARGGARGERLGSRSPPSKGSG